MLSTRTHVVLLSIALGLSCGRRFTEPMSLGGQSVSPAILNEGYEAYMEFCYACHGEKGDGHGPAALGLRPPPRDLRSGKFKFASVAAGELPLDEDLDRIITGGLQGTAMLPWQVPKNKRHAIIQYVKTLSDRWKKEKPGEKIVASPDPFASDNIDQAIGLEKTAIEKGRRVYHATAQCSNCHPAFITRKENYEATKELLGFGSPGRADAYFSETKESEYEVLGHKMRIRPPDFTRDEIRAGTTLQDLYRTIASGIGGAGMPKWKDALPEPDLWALAYYVRSLAQMKGTPAATALRKHLLAQPPFVEPVAPPVPAPQPQAPGGALPAPAGTAPVPQPQAPAAPAPAASPAGARPAPIGEKARRRPKPAPTAPSRAPSARPVAPSR